MPRYTRFGNLEIYFICYNPKTHHGFVLFFFVFMYLMPLLRTLKIVRIPIS